MKKLLKVFLSMMLLLFAVWAQAQTVRGTVTDENGETLPGVSVLEKGTVNGTVTDIDGNYELSVSQGAILQFSYIGFLTQEFIIEQSRTLNVSMEEDVVGLEEIVVVGIGSVKVKDLTSSIVTVKSDELVKTPTGQTMQALQGKVAGVQVVNAGAP